MAKGRRLRKGRKGDFFSILAQVAPISPQKTLNFRKYLRMENKKILLDSMIWGQVHREVEFHPVSSIFRNFPFAQTFGTLHLVVKRTFLSFSSDIINSEKPVFRFFPSRGPRFPFFLELAQNIHFCS